MRQARKGDMALIIGGPSMLGTMVSVRSDPVLTLGVSVSTKQGLMRHINWIAPIPHPNGYGLVDAVPTKHLMPIDQIDPDAQTTRSSEKERTA